MVQFASFNAVMTRLAALRIVALGTVLFFTFVMFYKNSTPPKSYRSTSLRDLSTPELKARLSMAENVCYLKSSKDYEEEDASKSSENYFPGLTVRALRADSPEEGFEFLARNTQLLKHFIVDDVHKVIYCYVPKVACTNWKKLVMILSGMTDATEPLSIPSDSVHRDGALHKLDEFSTEEIQYKLEAYQKFMFVRDPLVRMLSAFRNKFEKNYESSKYFKKRFGVKIQKLFRRGEDSQSVSPDGNGTTFAEFVEFLVHRNYYQASHFNEHWAPMVELCQPCLVRYDFIGKYENIEEESRFLLEAFGAPKSLSFPVQKASLTANKLPEYLAELTPTQRIRLQQLYAEDIELFGYAYRDFNRSRLPMGDLSLQF